ncbi:MAG TPA: PAS domain S-box protein [Myxococcota bacterium]|nr:PAS domain S-box protein [Myxococcota bacterium]
MLRARARAARGGPVAETVELVSVVYGATALAAIVAIFFAFPDPLWRMTVSAACLACTAAALGLVRAGWVRAGAFVLVSSCWLGIVATIARAPASSVVAQSALVLSVCSAGLLLGPAAGFAVALLSALVGPALGALDARDLHPGAPYYAIGLWLMQAAIFLSAAALVSITAAHAAAALRRARRSETRFRAIADNIGDIVIEFDSLDRFSYVNPAFLARRHMKSFDELAGMRIGDTIHPDDRERVVAGLRRVRDSGGTGAMTARVVTPEGETAIVDVTAGGIVYPSGERRVVTVSRDVTVQRQIEDALRDSEERYRMLAENAPDQIVEHDETGRIVYANPAARERGLPENPQDASDFGAWNHPDDVEKCRQAFIDSMTTGQVGRVVHRLRNKDGTYSWVSSSGAPYRTSKGKMHMVGQSRDITQELALQEQLRQAQKMEAIGRLAGGVAHDFNNLLTVIGGYAGVLESSAAGGPAAREAAREIEAAAERAAGLTRQLLSLSRRQLALPSAVDVNAVIRGLEPMLRRTLPQSIEIELSLDADLPSIQADPSQLDQVLLNLALNARDAMPSRGRLRIETRGDTGRRTIHLVVSDTGIGMSEATRLRAFEPFFTTKPPGEGSGLGLSTTYGIVRQIGGSIELESAPGCGTRVVIDLPAAQVGARGAPARSSLSTRVQRRDAAILLVEDDPAVRRLLTLVLENSGYRVFSAANGAEALELARNPGLALDLVLSDYVLPGISGVELCASLRRTRPGVHVVLMTGHAELPADGQAALPDGAGLLGKPFTREKLEAELARLLASS